MTRGPEEDSAESEEECITQSVKKPDQPDFVRYAKEKKDKLDSNDDYIQHQFNRQTSNQLVHQRYPHVSGIPSGNRNHLGKDDVKASIFNEKTAKKNEISSILRPDDSSSKLNYSSTGSNQTSQAQGNRLMNQATAVQAKAKVKDRTTSSRRGVQSILLQRELTGRA